MGRGPQAQFQSPFDCVEADIFSVGLDLTMAFDAGWNCRTRESDDHPIQEPGPGPQQTASVYEGAEVTPVSHPVAAEIHIRQATFHSGRVEARD